MIENENDYKECLKKIKLLWEAEPNTPEGDELNNLVTQVELYEESFHIWKFNVKNLIMNYVKKFFITKYFLLFVNNYNLLKINQL